MFLIGFHGAHEDEALQAMTYVRLCSELESSTTGSTKFMLLEAEKRRRDSVPTTKHSDSKKHHAPQESTSPRNNIKDWYEKPLGKIALSVTAATITLFVAYLLSKHFGIAP